jgi:hypothetical protein
MTLAVDEAWRVMDETETARPPSVPPPASDSATTNVWQPVRFLGEPLRWPADRPLPRHAQHASSLSHESVECTVDVGKPESTPAPNSGVVTQAPPAPDGDWSCRISRAGGAMACLLAVSGCGDFASWSWLVAGVAFTLAIVSFFPFALRRKPAQFAVTEAERVRCSTEALLAYGRADDMRVGILALQDFVRTMDDYYSGRPFTPSDTVLRATLIECIGKLSSSVARSQVSP